MWRRLWLAMRPDYGGVGVLGTLCWILTDHKPVFRVKDYKPLFSQADYTKRCCCGVWLMDFQEKKCPTV